MRIEQPGMVFTPVEEFESITRALRRCFDYTNCSFSSLEDALSSCARLPFYADLLSLPDAVCVNGLRNENKFKIPLYRNQAGMVGLRFERTDDLYFVKVVEFDNDE